jgi:chromosome segregation ATPase
MIQIRIENFQSHRETILDLHEEVNVLVGLTGAGKSVVFKALDWLFRNRPLGDEYRSWWGGNTRVEITLKEGQKVGRVRTDNDNYYYVDKKEFRAFGNGSPPQPVLDTLNLSEVNFQAQADPSFLISNSSGEVARYLNRVAHLDAIDQTLSNIASVLRKEKEDLNKTKTDLEQAQGRLVEYNWLPEADEKLAELENLQEKIVGLIDRRSSLMGILADYGKTEDELICLKEILTSEVETKRLILLDQEIERQNSRWESLAAIVDRCEKAEKELRSYDRLSEIERKWVELNTLYTNVYVLKNSQIFLKNIVQEVEEAMGTLGGAEGEMIKLKKEFDRLMPSVCPLCGQEVRK